MKAKVPGTLIFLGRIQGAERLRLLRAFEVFERLASPEAKLLLEGIANGARGTTLTLEARAAQKRLGNE
jgi:hypothetical protein